MKTLFVLKAVKHFSYHRSTIEQLCARGHNVRLVFLLRKNYPLSGHGIEECMERCQGRLSVEKRKGLLKSPFWRRAVIELRELRSYLSYLRRKGQSPFYAERWRGYLSRPVRFFTNLIPRLVLSDLRLERILRAVEERIPPDPAVLALVRSAEVDLVIASPANMHHSGEVEYLKAARRLGIPTVVSVLSWDNLSTKGIFHARPDLLLAWNEHHVRDAIEIHGFHKKQIKVVGSAFFDKWWGKLPEIPSRETFCRRIGLDPSRPILLYLGSSPSIAADERWLLTSLTKALKAEADKRIQEFQILVRPHPGHAIESGGCEGEGWTVWPKSGSLPSSSVEFSDFLSTLTYSELTVGINTSAMIDAVIRGLPSIAFLSPEYAKTQIESQHFQELLNGNAVYRTSSIDELIKMVRELAFEKKDPLKEARERFVIEHVRPHGLETEAGALSSIVLEDFLSRWQRRSLKSVRSKEQASNFSHLVLRAPRAELSPQRVLMATSLGSYHHGVVMDSVTGLAMKARGAEVEYLLCDQILSGCQAAKYGVVPLEVFQKHEKFPRCESCHQEGSAVFESTASAIHRYGDFISAEERQAMRQKAQAVPMEKIRTLVEDDIPVGEHAYAGALRFYARGDLTGQPSAETVLRAYLEAAFTTKLVAERLAGAGRYDVAVIHHGIYVPQGILVRVLRKAGVRVVTWNPAYRKHSFIYSHDDSYHHTMVTEPAANWEDLDLSPQRKTELMKYLKSRWYGTEDWIWFHSEPQHDVQKMAKDIGFDPSRPVIALLSNVVWDAQLHYASNAFPGMVEWVLETIAYFAKRPDLQLVIRIHPAEVRGFVPSRQPLEAEIRKAIPELPKNVFIVPPEHNASTYALCEASNAVLIYNTKTGMEVTAQGIPTIVAGEAWIRGKGFAEDPTTAEAYFSVLDKLPFAGRLSAEKHERAMKYAYHIFFRRMIPVPFLEPLENQKLKVQLKDPEELSAGRYLGIDVICEGILEAKPFIYPAEGLSVAEAKPAAVFTPLPNPA